MGKLPDWHINAATRKPRAWSQICKIVLIGLEVSSGGYKLTRSASHNRVCDFKHSADQQTVFQLAPRS